MAIGTERAFDNFGACSPKRTNVRIVRGKRSHGSSELFGEWAAALEFPYYFGHNWDAFDECINDLDWLGAEPLVVLVSRVDEVLADEPARFAGTFLQILKSAERTPGAPRKQSQDDHEHFDEGPRFVRFVFHSERAEIATDFPGLGDLPLRRIARDLE